MTGRPPRTLAGGAMGVHLDQRERLLIAASLGAVAAIATAIFYPWQLSVLAAWDVAAAFMVGSVWTFIAFLDAPSTAEVATREDDSRTVVNLIMVVASLVSLISVVVGLAKAKQVSGDVSTVLTSVAVLTVFLSWFTVHTLFVLRYAHLYYSKPVGGIDFANTKESPDYMDFVYVAFTVGMTFQVSDTGIADRSIRRTVIRQGLLSYVFGTVIFGVTINVVGNLFR